MDRVRELLARITELSDDELVELKDLVLQSFDETENPEDAEGSDPEGGAAPAPAEKSESTLAVLEELAEAATAIQSEFAKRRAAKEKMQRNLSSLNDFRDAAEGGEFEVKPGGGGEGSGGGKRKKSSSHGAEDEEFEVKPGGGGEGSGGGKRKKNSSHSGDGNGEFSDDEDDEFAEGGVKRRNQDAGGSSGAGGNNPPEGPAETPPDTGAGGSTSEGHGGGELVPGASDGSEDEQRRRRDAATASAQVPEGRRPQRRQSSTTVITAGADLPGWSMGAPISNPRDLADAMTRRIHSMRGVRGGDGDKLIAATAAIDLPDELHLKTNESEGNLAKIEKWTAPSAIVAAGGLAAPEESKYDLFGMGVTDRPVRSALPVFKADRGGVRFIRPPVLNDLQGAVGVWTVEDDIEAATNVNVRKPAFRVNHGPEIVVDTQAITMILTFGNMVSRAYPELVARHNELALVAQARVAEQQLLTQIGALSTHVTGRSQQLSAVRETLMQIDMAAASYRNRHRTGNIPLQVIMPMWFMDLLRADIAAQHPGDGLEIFDIASTQIEGWFRSRNLNVTWAMDGEVGQDYQSFNVDSSGNPVTGPNLEELFTFPETIVWYMYVEGTFAFMDAGTLDLGLVRDSTLNSANDYQMFVESFENVVKFGHEALRVETPLVPTGQGSADVVIDLGA